MGLEVTGGDRDGAAPAHTRRQDDGIPCVHRDAYRLPFAGGRFDFCAGITSLCFIARVDRKRVTRRQVVRGLLRRYSPMHGQEARRGGMTWLQPQTGLRIWHRRPMGCVRTVPPSCRGRVSWPRSRNRGFRCPAPLGAVFTVASQYGSPLGPPVSCRADPLCIVWRPYKARQRSVQGGLALRLLPRSSASRRNALAAPQFACTVNGPPPTLRDGDLLHACSRPDLDSFFS